MGAPAGETTLCRRGRPASHTPVGDPSAYVASEIKLAPSNAQTMRKRVWTCQRALPRRQLPVGSLAAPHAAEGNNAHQIPAFLFPSLTTC
jgi:hypothetical protein